MFYYVISFRGKEPQAACVGAVEKENWFEFLSPVARRERKTQKIWPGLEKGPGAKQRKDSFDFFVLISKCLTSPYKYEAWYPGTMETKNKL